jgi:hypothetical protein
MSKYGAIPPADTGGRNDEYEENSRMSRGPEYRDRSTVASVENDVKGDCETPACGVH